MKGEMEIRFWGTRGSMAAPYPDRMEYGGNTSCVSARWAGGIAVFDCGTGLRGLGMSLLAPVPENVKEMHIFVSHLHLDHICGLPFLPQLFMKDWTIHFYGEARTEAGFEEDLSSISYAPYWPVSLKQAPASIVWHPLKAGENVSLDEGVTVHSVPSNHPNGSTLYRMESRGASMVYGLDCELTDDFYETYVQFAQDCDLLIFDGAYTEEEYPRYRGFGHSTWQKGIQLKESCNAGILCITHHEWGRTDQQLEQLEQQVQAECENAMLAREGMQFLLGERK